MSLIEVMIVMTIMSLIGLGTATLMKNMFSIQKRSNLKAVALEIKNNMETMLKNDTAWGFTIMANGSLNCLRDGVGACNERPYSGNPTAPGAVMAADPAIYDTNNVVWYSPAVATNGFNGDDGSFCNTFNAGGGLGDDLCPFHYSLSIYSECPGVAVTCAKPQLTIFAQMTFNPADPSDPRNRLNVDDYRIVFRRGERVRYEPLEIVEVSTGSAAGGGACDPNPSNFAVRPLSSVSYDSGGNVVNFNDAADQFTLASGTYECKVISQGYEALNGFKVVLQDITNGNSYPAGSSYSGQNSTAYATGTMTIELAANATFQLQHYCGGVGSANSAFDMGIPAQVDTTGTAATDYASGSIFTSITCVRSS